MTPIFAEVGSRILNVAQIKWVGVKDNERVYVEFITGGWILLEPGITLEDFTTILRQTMEAAAPY